MSYDDKLGQNGGTQTAPSEVPRHPYLQHRKGFYYFRVRIPADLLRAGVFGKRKEIKESQKTGVPQQAARLAATRKVYWEEQFEQRRRELKAGVALFRSSKRCMEG